MKIEIGGDRTIDNPSDSEIRRTLETLGTQPDSYIILEQDQMTYLQAAGDPATGFVLEYQEGSTDRHFQSRKTDLPLDVVAEAFSQYRQGIPDWRVRIEFEKLAI